MKMEQTNGSALSVYVSVSLCCVAVCLYVSLFLRVSLCVSVILYVSLCVSVSLCLSLCVSVCFSACLYVFLCVSVCLFCVAVCLYVCLYVSQCVSICLCESVIYQVQDCEDLRRVLRSFYTVQSCRNLLKPQSNSLSLSSGYKMQFVQHST